MRTPRLLWAACALLLLIVPASAQTTPAASTEHVSLGHSTVPLYGPWKFQTGDSPLTANGTPLWAQPGFDDSQWESTDLKPANGAFDPVIGTGSYVLGWGAKGHPNYSGYAWYRLRVQMDVPAGQPLALGGPANIDDAYEAFANGIRLGSFGKFPASGTPTAYNTRPRMFSLPPANGTGTTEYVIAFRVYMEPSTIAFSPEAGGMHVAPRIGEATAIEAQYRLDWLGVSRGYAFSPVMGIVFFVLSLVALSLRLFDRTDSVYLWLAAAFFLVFLSSLSLTLTAWTEVFSLNGTNLALAIYRPAVLLLWLLVWKAWFQLRLPRWMTPAMVALTLLLTVARVVSALTLSVALADTLNTTSIVVRLLLLMLMFYLVALGIREQGREAWFIVVVVMLVGISMFQDEMILLHVRAIWFPFGFQLTLSTITNLTLALLMSVLLLRRLWVSVQRQRALAQDVQQTRELQHVLLPEQARIPGLAVEWEYRPVLDVGGDFFQIIPHATDGSTLVVAGDVAGKGLAAGMLVALLVGAVRSTAEVSAEPLAVLEALNRRLLGRGDALATCLILRIEKDGMVTLANAGHLAPYVDGAELEMEGSLPLGVVDGVEFPVMRFALAAGSRMVLISDGLPEAQDKDGKLFGFDRVREMMAAHRSVGAMADEVQAFGQSDDISVVSVVRA